MSMAVISILVEPRCLLFNCFGDLYIYTRQWYDSITHGFPFTRYVFKVIVKNLDFLFHRCRHPKSGKSWMTIKLTHFQKLQRRWIDQISVTFVLFRPKVRLVFNLPSGCQDTALRVQGWIRIQYTKTPKPEYDRYFQVHYLEEHFWIIVVYWCFNAICFHVAIWQYAVFDMRGSAQAQAITWTTGWTRSLTHILVSKSQKQVKSGDIYFGF